MKMEGIMLKSSIVLIVLSIVAVGSLAAEGRGWLRGSQVLDSRSDVHIANVSQIQPRVGDEFDVFRIILDANPALRGMRHRYSKLGRVRVVEIVDPHTVRASVIWGLSGDAYLIQTE